MVVVVHERLAGEHKEPLLRNVVHELDLADAAVLGAPLGGAGLLGEVAGLGGDEHLAGVRRPAEGSRPIAGTRGGGGRGEAFTCLILAEGSSIIDEESSHERRSSIGGRRY